MTYKIHPFLDTHPCFSLVELNAFLLATRQCSDKEAAETAVTSILRRWSSNHRTVEVAQIRPGLFVTAKAIEAENSADWLPYLIPMSTSKDAVLGFQAAFWLHLGRPAPPRIQFYGKGVKGEKNWDWEGFSFESITSNQQPMKRSNSGIPPFMMLQVVLSGRVHEIRVTTPEQTLVDMLDGRRRGVREGDPEEVKIRNEAKACQISFPVEGQNGEVKAERAELDSEFLAFWSTLPDWRAQLDFGVLRNYLKALNSLITTSKTGYALEAHYKALGLKAVHLYKLGKRPTRPRAWIEGLPSTLNYRWMLKVPDHLQHSPIHWEGPHSNPQPRLKNGHALETIDLRDELRKAFWRNKIEKFRDCQEELIREVLEGRDALGVIPTGAGKSLTFQFPSLLLNGVTLVISPLVALMNDQVCKATTMGLKAHILRMNSSAEEKDEIFQAIEKKSLNLIFISPESLFPIVLSSRHLMNAIVQVVVDEAHLLTTWGRDFRFSFQKLKAIRELMPETPILALTATATPEVRERIMEHLGFRAQTEPLTLPMFRPGLYLQRMEVSNFFEDKMNALSKFLLLEKEGCGIVYCSTKDETEKVGNRIHALLYPNQENPPPKGYIHFGSTSIRCYHAGMSTVDRQEAEEAFRQGRCKIMVATVAFGMGIDKSDVRFVTHFGPPSSIEQYVQEVGRGGRDGWGAHCLVLHSKSDWKIWGGRFESERKKLQKNINRIGPHQFEQKLKRLSERESSVYQIKGLLLGKKCLHQVINHYFDENINPCKHSCSYCEEPALHRSRIRKNRKFWEDLIPQPSA